MLRGVGERGKLRSDLITSPTEKVVEIVSGEVGAERRHSMFPKDYNPSWFPGRRIHDVIRVLTII